jgi:sec-independent protein translocase protein TatA
MGSFSLMHWIVVLAIVVLLFGAGKIPRLMGDFAKGIKAFKSGMKEEDDETAAAKPAAPQVSPPQNASTQSTTGAHTAERV